MTPRRSIDAGIEQRLDEQWEEIRSVAPGLSKEKVLDQASLLARRHPMITVYNLDLVPKGTMARQLKNFAAKARAAIAAINDLHPSLQHHLGIDGLRQELARYRTLADELAPSRVGQSGGSPKKRLEREMKTAAARMSFALLRSIDVEPSLTFGGPWFVLTEILFYVALDRDLGDASRVCSQVRSQYNSRPRLS